jgi:hypothetical protein
VFVTAKPFLLGAMKHFTLQGPFVIYEKRSVANGAIFIALYFPHNSHKGPIS